MKHIGDDRREESLDGHVERLSLKKRTKIEAITLSQFLTYFRHRITKAVSEGLNSKIQTIKKMAYGYRNREPFKIAIYFHCGGLEIKKPIDMKIVFSI